jgi:hypothetical protein
VDGSGNAYLTGQTITSGTPSSAFVSKLDATGSTQLYTTYFGTDAFATGIAVDSSGNAYFTGYASSTFPTVNPVQPVFGGGSYDAFVAKLNASGSTLLFSTFLGGGGDDRGYSIAVDGSGNAYVTGLTHSTNFPTANPFQPALAGGSIDGFVAKISDAPLRFIPVTPCRVADTRDSPGPLGGPSLVGQMTRAFPVAASSCAIPSTAKAYSLNATVVPRGLFRYLTLWPTGFAQPFVSTLNSYNGQVAANAAIVQAGIGGSINAYASEDTDFILDINGYFVDATNNSALLFYPLTPCRVADTRNPGGPLGGPILSGRSARSFPILSSSCGIPATAQAYVLNATAVPDGFLDYLTLWPTGTAQPFVSNLNSYDGQATAGMAIVRAGAGGAIDAYATDNTHLVLDITGYFAPPAPGGLHLFTTSPCRLVDTRNPNGPFGGPVMSAGSTRSFSVLNGVCSVAATAQAYLINATVVPSGALDYLTVWPTGLPQPFVSTLNSRDGRITANALITPAGTSGAVSAFVTNETQLILDLNGFFAP